MNNLKHRLTQIANDVFTIEAAILQEKKGIRQTVTYSKVLFEGDAINYVDKNLLNQSIVDLHKSMLMTSIHSRYALMRILTEALK